MIQKRTIGIIGSGHVGVATAYALFMRESVNEIILVDKDARRAEGEAMDLMHGQPYVEKSISVRAGDFMDLSAAQIVIVSAGVAQRPGESRLDLLARNAEALRQITQQLDRYAPDGVVIVASNPVDILTYIMQEVSQRPTHRVIGTGTMLDTGRFRSVLGRHYGVDPKSVHAYILGEHGDSEVPIWSKAHIGGVPIVDHVVMGKPFDPSAMQNLFAQVRDAAYQIIARKGYTNTAIGSVIARLTKAILEDQQSVLTVSVRVSGEYGLKNVCLSLPGVIGLNGVSAKILPDLSPDEIKGMQNSAHILRQHLKALAL